MSPGSPARERPHLGRTRASARWDEYRQLLRAARYHGYRTVALEEWVDGDGASDDRVLILRHDVDQAPRSALRMLELEQEEGARATWYFRWRTARPQVVRRVRESGVGVGLHYETLTRMLLERGLPGSQAPGLVEEARAGLRQEIASFRARFGPIRSVCPHGDTRVEGVRNSVLLEGEDCLVYGVEFDGNAAMREHRVAYWLTDRLAADGGWAEGVRPEALFEQGVSPILCVVHPNNWASGISLWSDRLARDLLRGRPLGPLTHQFGIGLPDSPPKGHG